MWDRIVSLVNKFFLLFLVRKEWNYLIINYFFVDLYFFFYLILIFVFFMLVFYLINFFFSKNFDFFDDVSSFECGFFCLGYFKGFNVNFFLLMVIFVIFDLEIVILLRIFFSFSFLMFFFILLFFLGGFYLEWYLGKLVWIF